MFGFTFKKPETLYSALIDVGSGSVGVAIIKSNHSKANPEILFSHRVNVDLSNRTVSREDLFRQLRETLISASLILSQEGTKALRKHNNTARVSKIHLTVSAPWAVTIARQVTYDHGEPLVVTDDLLTDLRESAESEIEQAVTELPLMKSLNLNIVERSTTGITVNDYQVVEPRGLSGSLIGLTHITGLISEIILDWVTEVRDKIFVKVPLKAHTTMLVTYCVVRDLFPDSVSCCTINITGEATEFGIVEDNNLVETTSTPYGTNTIVRDIIKRTNKTATDVVSLLRSADSLTAADRAVASEFMKPYISTISDTFKLLSESRTVPRLIIVTTQTQLADTFSAAIKEALEQSGGKDFTIIQTKDLLKPELAKNPDLDIYLTLSACFFHKLHVCGEMSK